MIDGFVKNVFISTEFPSSGRYRSLFRNDLALCFPPVAMAS
jgi:hypothetical protein